MEDYEFLEGKEEQLKKIVTEIAKGKKAEVKAVRRKQWRHVGLGDGISDTRQ